MLNITRRPGLSRSVVMWSLGFMSGWRPYDLDFVGDIYILAPGFDFSGSLGEWQDNELATFAESLAFDIDTYTLNKDLVPGTDLDSWQHSALAQFDEELLFDTDVYNLRGGIVVVPSLEQYQNDQFIVMSEFVDFPTNLYYLNKGLDPGSTSDWIAATLHSMQYNLNFVTNIYEDNS